MSSHAVERDGGEGADSSRTSNTSEPQAWDGIQEYMLNHDKDTISDYTDNIDTLLVFAGLSSAVLTALISESIAMLRRDDSQVSMQLLTFIALRVATISAMPTVAGKESAVASPSFVPSFGTPASSIILNVLWFTSLVLSLAAALLGILAKEWCREYLKWHSVLQPSRDNVLLRQMRYDAWRSWHVPFLITLIPFFLELSLALFLTGLIVFAWKLSLVLAVIVTTLVGIVLLAAIIFHMLPFFRRLCPYKSRAGWALACIYQFICRPRRWAFGLRVDREVCKNWRTWDLHVAQVPELCPIPRSPPADTLYKPSWTDEVLDAFQTMHLVRALSWARRGSTDDNLLKIISQSVLTLHDPHQSYATPWQIPYVHSALRNLCDASGLKPKAHVVADAIRTHCLRLLRGTQEFNSSGSHQLQTIFTGHVLHWVGPYVEGVIPDAAFNNWSTLRIIRQLVYRDLLNLVDVWIACDDARAYRCSELAAEEIAMVLCTLRCVPPGSHHDGLFHEDKEEWIRTLATVFHTLSPRQTAHAQGLVSMILEFLCTLDIERVNINFTDHSVTVRHPPTSAEDHPGFVLGWIDLAVQIYEGTNNYCVQEWRHLFVVSVIPALGAIQCGINNWKLYGSRIRFPQSVEIEASLARLISCMTDAATFCLENGYMDCGGYVELPWISSLADLYKTAQKEDIPFDNIPLTGDFGIRLRLLRLLSALQENLMAGLLTGNTVRTQFDELLRLLQLPRALLEDNSGDSWHTAIDDVA